MPNPIDDVFSNLLKGPGFVDSNAADEAAVPNKEVVKQGLVLLKAFYAITDARLREQALESVRFLATLCANSKG